MADNGALKFGKKVRELDFKNFYYESRESWAEICNQELSAKSLPLIDHRSNKNRGIKTPANIHVGVSSWNLAKKGIKTDRYKRWEEIKQQREEIAILESHLLEINKEIQNVRRNTNLRYAESDPTYFTAKKDIKCGNLSAESAGETESRRSTNGLTRTGNIDNDIYKPDSSTDSGADDAEDRIGGESGGNDSESIQRNRIPLESNRKLFEHLNNTINQSFSNLSNTISKVSLPVLTLEETLDAWSKYNEYDNYIRNDDSYRQEL